MTRVVDWNGRDVPEGLRSLPPGRYVVQQLDSAPPLTDGEEEGLREAMRSLDAGEGRTLEQVRGELGVARK